MNNSPTQKSPRRFMDFAPRTKAPRVKAPQAKAQRPVAPVRPTPMSRPVVPHPPKPVPRPETHFVHEHIETKVMYPTARQHTSHLVEEDDFLDIETSGLGIIEDLSSSTTSSTPSTPDSPDNSSFIFGGRSPFINTDKVDKRPLSSHIPKEKSAAKNIYDKPSKGQKATKSLKKSITPTVVKGSASRGSNISLAIAITLTVILGAVVGTFLYLAFFQ